MIVTRTIVIERIECPAGERWDRDVPGWRIREGDRLCDGLGWDELIAQLATITHPMIPPGKGLHGGMLTPEEQFARRRKRRDEGDL